MKTIEVGTHVTDSGGRTYTFAGPREDGRSGSRVTYKLGAHSEAAEIQTDPRTVIPTAEMPNDLPLKDARIEVANDKAGRPGAWAGSWRAQTPGDTAPHWHKTKRDAVESAARRLVIQDWWNG